ncbi:O-antigen ligase family protein [Candidatus Kaiserbacteria bacterium]|nr:O-antigen ligase family protein [Candidatus Kaiserbacteria bacterium]
MKYIARAYPWLLISPALLPVVIAGGTIYPYLVPKTLLFYALSLLSLGAFLLLAASGRAFFFARLERRETWIPGALLALAYLASAAGLDFYRSFWSTFARGDGLLMLTGAVASFYLILLSADKVFFERLIRAVALIASAVALYGIGEWLFAPSGRIGGLLGNAEFFAGYLGIAFFATLLAARTLSPGLRRACYLGAALEIIAILFSATRGTILALALAGVVALVYFTLTQGGRPRGYSAGALAALVILAGLFFGFRAELVHVPFQPIARIASIGTHDPDVASRLFVWRNMIGEIAKSPWLGYGAEHVDTLFNRFYDPTKIQEQWFDRSHNAFLDYAAEFGVGGLLLYLALIASFFLAARRVKAQGEPQVAGLFALLALTYALQNFFVFDTVSSFWLLLALLAAFLAGSLGDTSPRALLLPRYSRYAAGALALILALLIIPLSAFPALAAHDVQHAYLYQITDVREEAQSLARGSALGTYADLEYSYEAYDMYANTQAARLTGPSRVTAYQSALPLLISAFNRYPYDARTALYLAHVLSLAPPDTPPDQKLFSAALERAIRLSPKRSQPRYILVNLSLTEANAHPAGSQARRAGYAKARDLLTRYIALVPELAEPHFVLAEISRTTGDSAGASAEAALGKADYKSDLQTARRAAAYYENTLDLPNAAFFLAEVVRLDPSDTAATADLAKIKAHEQSGK